MSGQAKVLDREIDAGQHKIVHVGKLMNDPANVDAVWIVLSLTLLSESGTYLL